MIVSSVGFDSCWQKKNMVTPGAPPPEGFWEWNGSGIFLCWIHGWYHMVGGHLFILLLLCIVGGMYSYMVYGLVVFHSSWFYHTLFRRYAWFRFNKSFTMNVIRSIERTTIIMVRHFILTSFGGKILGESSFFAARYSHLCIIHRLIIQPIIDGIFWYINQSG